MSQAAEPADLARKMAARRTGSSDDGFLREMHTLPRLDARRKAQDFLERYPSAAYMSRVETWRALPDDRIEFTMKRLRTAD